MDTLFTAGGIVDGISGSAREDAALLVRDGRILAVGDDALRTAPRDARRVDLRPGVIMPGLIDCHVHLTLDCSPAALFATMHDPEQRAALRAAGNMQAALRAGITTVRDCGAPAGVTLALARAERDGLITGPRVVASGAPVTTTGGHCWMFGLEAEGIPGVQAAVRRMCRSGADFIKVMVTGGALAGSERVAVASAERRRYILSGGPSVRIAEGIEALEVPMTFMGNRGIIHPAIVWDDRDGATLIDAGVPGQVPVLEKKLQALGLKLHDVRRILITHQDLDHIGSAHEIANATGAEVYAHSADVPYIQGEKPLLKLDAKRFEAQLQALPPAQQERIREILSSPPRVKVDRVLSGGEELPFHGGIVVVPTPGHTPGHVCYYLKAHRVLVAGDSLRAENGVLIGPSPLATPDMRRAIASLKNLQPYRIDAVLCYHGGIARQDVEARLHELARIKT